MDIHFKKALSKSKGGLRGLIGPSILLFSWWIGSHKAIWNPFIIPSPESTVQALISMIEDGSLIGHVVSSTGRILSGFAIALVAAIPTGVLSGLSPGFSAYFSSSLSFLNHLPPLALFPVLMLWFGIGEPSKIGVIFLASFFPIYLNTMEGVRTVNKSLVEASRSCGASTWKTFIHVTFPCAVPGIITGMRVGLSYGWRSLVGAELVASSSGLGFLLHRAEVFSRPDIMAATLITMGILGILLDRAIGYLTMSDSDYMERLRRR